MDMAVVSRNRIVSTAIFLLVCFVINTGKSDCKPLKSNPTSMALKRCVCPVSRIQKSADFCTVKSILDRLDDRLSTQRDSALLLRHDLAGKLTCDKTPCKDNFCQVRLALYNALQQSSNTKDMNTFLFIYQQLLFLFEQSLMEMEKDKVLKNEAGSIATSNALVLARGVDFMYHDICCTRQVCKMFQKSPLPPEAYLTKDTISPFGNKECADVQTAVERGHHVLKQLEIVESRFMGDVLSRKCRLGY